MPRRKTTLSLVKSDGSHGGGCCRSRTTGNVAALRLHLNAPASRGSSRELHPANQSPAIDVRLHRDLAYLQVDVWHLQLVIEVLVPALVDVELLVYRIGIGRIPHRWLVDPLGGAAGRCPAIGRFLVL
jgi:hypothetical protein